MQEGDTDHEQLAHQRLAKPRKQGDKALKREHWGQETKSEPYPRSYRVHPSPISIESGRFILLETVSDSKHRNCAQTMKMWIKKNSEYHTDMDMKTSSPFQPSSS